MVNIFYRVTTYTSKKFPVDLNSLTSTILEVGEQIIRSHFIIKYLVTVAYSTDLLILYYYSSILKMHDGLAMVWLLSFKFGPVIVWVS